MPGIEQPTPADFISWAQQELREPAQQQEAEQPEPVVDFITWATNLLQPEDNAGDPQQDDDAFHNVPAEPATSTPPWEHEDLDRWLDQWLASDAVINENADLLDHVPARSVPVWKPARGSGAFKRRANGDLVGGQINDGPQLQFEVIGSTAHAPEKAWGGRLTSQATEYIVKHNLQHITDIFFAAEAIDSMIEGIVRTQVTNANDDDYIALKICHPELTQPLRISFHQKKNFKPQAFLDSIYRWVQSGTVAFLMTGKLTLEVSVLSSSSGSSSKAKRDQAPNSIESFFGAKKGITKIINTGDDCGYLAVTLAKLCADDETLCRSKDRNRWNKLTKPNSNHLQAEKKKLFSALEIDTSQPLNATMFEVIQSRLTAYQLAVIERPSATGIVKQARGMAPLFLGPLAKKQLLIEYVAAEQHYNVIKSVTAYFQCNSWCMACWTSIDVRSHKCIKKCSQCGEGTDCSPEAEPITCFGCCRQFFGPDCMAMHRCKKFKVACPDCEVEYGAKEQHTCGVFHCTKCKVDFTETPHFCFIAPLNRDKLIQTDSRLKIIVAFDIESRLVDAGDGVKDHVANLLISNTICDNCVRGTEKKNTTCATCGVLQREFFGDDCTARFCDYVLLDLASIAEKMKAYVFVYAHNFKAYDGRFVLRELFKRKLTNIEPVFVGSKALKIDCGNVRFLDSCSLFSLPLSGLPKAFDFDRPLQKGHFPFLFNQVENYSYGINNDQPHPPIEMYDPLALTPKARDELEVWYSACSHLPFNFMRELFAYCSSDVEILLFAIQKFRILFKQQTGIDPTTRNFTLALVAFEDFRASHLAENKIGITPMEGYINPRKSSAESNAWLDLCDRTLGRKVKREFKIGPFYADAFDPETNTVFEYWGCYYHGCPRCYTGDQLLIHDKPAASLLKHTERKRQYYARRGFTLVEIWGCDGLLAMDYVRERKQRWHEVLTGLKSGVREALTGGRTENFRLFFDSTQPGNDEAELRYVDFTSLYPFVLKNRPFPIGHPELITEDINYESGKYFGFAWATVLPPRDMRFPVLPYRARGKLMFCLCRSCCENEATPWNRAPCAHSDQQRALTGVFVTAELDEAVSCGYRIIDCTSVLHYEKQETGLFASYINTWLKIKQEKSGKPTHIETGEDMAKYVSDYEAREGIKLDPSSIERNEGLRFISKLMLNSLWGKLSQRENLDQTEIVSTYQQLMAMVGDSKKEVKAAEIVHEDTVIATWCWRDPLDARQGKTSPAIASFVTAWARLELHKLIHQVEQVRPNRCHYADTDSLIFEHRKGDPEIDLGDYLGDLTSELGDWKCIKGVFPGCKTYCLVLRRGDETRTIVKVKGMSLTAEALTIVNAESMEQLLKTFTETGVIEERAVPQQQFFAVREQQLQKTRRFDKVFRVTSEKRAVYGFDTFPYGYVKENK